MLLHFFYILNLLVVFSGILVLWMAKGERCYSLALVQALVCLPLLAGGYCYLAYQFEESAVQSVLFSESIFGLIWLFMTRNLYQATVTTSYGSRGKLLREILIGGIAVAAAGYFLAYCPVTEVLDSKWRFAIYSPVYFFAILILLTFLYSSWRLEQFWRSLNGTQRWEYKFLVIGSFLVSGAFVWSSSYRLTYFTIAPDQLQLLSTLLLLGWAMIFFAVVHHRLLNRKIFISRKIIYSFVVPTLLAAYLLGFGIVSLIMQTFGLQMSYVLKWLMLSFGVVSVGLFTCSGKMRRRVQFFISTHFYINKYEYRDEWLALSEQLQGALTETDVIKALRQVLGDCLYTSEIFIWLGDSESSMGYRCVDLSNSPDPLNQGETSIGPDDPLVQYLKGQTCYYTEEEEPDALWKHIAGKQASFLANLNLRILAPILIGNQLVGIIGLGPEYTGGKYGHDDFDLLTALGSQTASALLAIRMAEELARAREQQAWNRLSAFVLHDIKNAATMLALLQENAPEHIHEPAFQQDMLELVGDALRRMGRVEQRLRALKDECTPELQCLEFSRFLQDCIRRLKKKLPFMEIMLEGTDKIKVMSDAELFGSVLENLLLNAYEAHGEGAIVRIMTHRDGDADQVVVEITDNGPGIAAELLPEALFEPLKTSKEGGSGIGLWQVKRVVASLGGTISADNSKDGGAQFVIRLPTGGSVE